MQSRTPWDSDKTWRGKAKRIIHKLCAESYRKANPDVIRRSMGHYKHKPYTSPELAADLVECLDKDDELRAKSLFHSYEGMKAIGA